MEILDHVGEEATTARDLSRTKQGDREVVAIMNRERDRMIEYRSTHHKKWPAYGRLTRGDHWHGNDPIGGDAQITWNVGDKIISVNDALLTQGRVRFEIMSMSPESDMKARALDARGQEVQDRNRIGLVQSAMVNDAMTYGLGLMYSWWDEDRRNGRGDHAIDWFDIYNFFVDPEATSVNNWQIVSLRHIYTLAMANALWPEFKGQLKGEAAPPKSGSSGLYRPREDLPNVRSADGTSVTLYGTDSSGGAYITDRDKYGSKIDPDEQVHVWTHYVRARWADEAITPRQLAAMGRSEETKAKQEHRDLLRGIPLEPEIGDDHGVHLKIHQDFMKVNAERMTAEMNLMVSSHMDLHRDMLRKPEWRQLRYSRYPGGWRRIRIAGNILLDDGATETGSQYLPIAVMRGYPDNGHFFGRGIWTNNEGLQHAINLTPSQTLDAMRGNAHRPTAVDAASDITNDMLVNQVGAILRCTFENGRAPIEWPTPTPIDQAWLAFAKDLKLAFEEMEGISPYTEGQVRGASPYSGAAISALQQGGTIRVQKRSDDLVYTMTDVGRAFIAQAVKFDVDPMTVKARLNPDRLPEGAVPTQQGDGSYFTPINGPNGMNSLSDVDPDQMDVRVNASGTVASGKIERRNEVVGLGREGLLHPQLVREALAEIGILTPQQLQRQLELEAQAVQMQMQAQPPPGPPTHPPPAQEAFGDFPSQGNSLDEEVQ